MPVAEHYEAQGRCVRISAVPAPDDVFTEVCLRISTPLLVLSQSAAKPVRSMPDSVRNGLQILLLWQGHAG